MQMVATPKKFQSLPMNNMQVKKSTERCKIVLSELASIEGVESEGEEDIIKLFRKQLVEYEDPTNN